MDIEFHEKLRKLKRISTPCLKCLVSPTCLTFCKPIQVFIRKYKDEVIECLLNHRIEKKK